MTPVDHADDSPDMAPWALVKFMRHVHDHRDVLEEVAVYGLEDTAVEDVASRYRREDYLLFDNQGRSMHPAECLTAALDSDDRAIMVVPRPEQNLYLTTAILSKRKADEDDGDLNPRPRKFLMVPPK